MKRLERKYSIKKKGSHVVKEEIRQRIVAKAAKVKRYSDRIKQFRQNRLYRVNQKELFREINGNNNVHIILCVKESFERSVICLNGRINSTIPAKRSRR